MSEEEKMKMAIDLAKQGIDLEEVERICGELAKFLQPIVDLAMKKNNCRLDKRRLRIEITGQAPKGKKNKQSE